MRSVRDENGDTYLVRKATDEAYLLVDPATGTEEYRPRSAFEPVADTSPLSVAATGVPRSIRRVLTATHDDRSLGLLVEIVDRSPVAVTDLLEEYDLCESALHGLLSEFTAAGLIEETTVWGTRGYEPTPLAIDAIDRIRGDRSDYSATR
ncbi:MAG: DUF7346 family protein [Halobacteriota archaeon]